MEAKTWHDTVGEPPCGLCKVFDRINDECSRYNARRNCPEYLSYIHHSEQAEKTWPIAEAEGRRLAESRREALDNRDTNDQREIDALETELADLKQELTNFDTNYTGAESGDLHVYNEQWEVFKEKWLK